MSRLEIPENAHIHAADAAAHSLGASSVTAVLDDDGKLVAVETDADIKQKDFDKAIGEHSKKVAARQNFLGGIEEITGVKVPTSVNAVEVFVSSLLEVLLLSDDETKAKLVEHVKAFQKSKKSG